MSQNVEEKTKQESGSELIKNITLPNSQFKGIEVAGKGFAIGIENVQITQFSSTLEEALNKIGYGVDKDEEGEEILVKVGETDFETIANIVRALIHTSLTNNINNNG